ncbi:MAG: TolC family protein [Nitrospirota bacterium]|nr:TolC family protein [Nitrospirota bacterium]
MQKLIPVVLLLIFLFPLNAEAEELIKKDESLNLERCIEIAIKKHPNIIAAANTVDINQSRIGQSKANYYPQLSWISGYSKFNALAGSRDQVVVTTDRTLEEYSSSVNLNQTIFDFGKTATNVNIQRLNLYSSRSDFENVTDQIIFNVKQAYYGVLQAKRNRDVAAETVKQYELHLEQAKGFFQVGTKPKFDVTKAEVDLSNAKLNLIKAENALRVARVTLNNAMGITVAPEYYLVDNLTFKKYEIQFEKALGMAYANRPDLRSIIAKKEAAGESIELAKKDYYPTLSGNASYNWAGRTVTSLDNGWNVGATLTFPLFSGFLTKYQVEESKANLNVLKANEESLRQSVLLEVQQAYLNLHDAEERIPTAEIAVRQAEENLDIANGRYAAGVGNPIEVTDAQVAYTSAKTSYIQALYDYKVAQASLEKAMGVK